MSDDAFPWFRVYTSINHNQRLALLADEDSMKFIKLLAMKRTGELDSDAPHLERRIGITLKLSEQGLSEVKRRIMEVGLIDENWQPINWERRQFASDTNGAERVQRHRERKRNVTVTLRGNECNALDTETESEKRTESYAGAVHAAVQQNTNPDTPPPGGGSAEGGTPRKRVSVRGAKRMPIEYQPSVMLQTWAATECPLVDFERELQVIRDHEFGHTHSDWDATVRNWMRREQKQFAQRRTNGAHPVRETKFQAMRRRLDEI